MPPAQPGATISPHGALSTRHAAGGPAADVQSAQLFERRGEAEILETIVALDERTVRPARRLGDAVHRLADFEAAPTLGSGVHSVDLGPALRRQLVAH